MLVLVSAIFALVVVVVLAWIATGPGFKNASKLRFSPGQTWQNSGITPPVFLFENSKLNQANSTALRLLGNADLGELTWPDVRTVLSEVVPQLPVSLKTLSDGSRVYPEQREPLAHHLSIEHKAPYTRIELQLGDWKNPTAPGQEALEAPFPIWAESSDGKIIWKNRAFNKTKLALHLSGPGQMAKIKADRRISVPARNGDTERHYKILSKQLDDCTVYYALNAADTVAAEQSRSDVVQTLGKTFAQLSTGLVVFDGRGNLVLFNPAVIDLFGFSAGYLSARPSLESFFDHMRDNRMIPEPKDYLAWRKRIKERVSNSSDTRFRENWQLPNGATIRATGLPNPDGGVGFLFEDISAQVTTTRRFRDELSMSHALLDSLADGVVAIDAIGRVVFANKAFQSHWKIDPDSSFADFTEADLLNALKQDIAPNCLEQLSSFIQQTDEHQNHSLSCNTKDGKPINFQLSRAKGQLIVLRHAVPAEELAADHRIPAT